MAGRSLGTLTLDLIAKIGGFIGPMDKAGRKAEDFGKQIKTVGKAATALGTGVAVGFGAMVKHSIDFQDEMSKSSQKIAIGTEELSGLVYNAKLADVSIEELTGSLGKFNKGIGEAYTTGVGATSDALSDLGIKVTDTNGKLKSTYDIFEEVAGQFSKLEDGAVKTNLSMDLFGKSGKDLIPLLNAGAKGLREGADEAQRYGQIIGGEAAKKAEEFNDNLTRLQASFTGVANTVAGNAIPELAKFSEQLKDPALQNGIATIANGLVRIGTGAVVALGELGKFINFNAEELAAQINGISNQDIPRLTARLEELNAQLNPKNLTDYFMNSEVGDIFSSSQDLETERENIKKNIDAWKKYSIEKIKAGQGSVVKDDIGDDPFALTAEQIKANAELREAKKKQAEDDAAFAKQLQKNFEDTRANLQKEIDLYDQASQVSGIRYETELGDLKKLSAAQKQELLDRAKILDLKERDKILMDSQRDVDLSAMGDKGQLASVQMEYDLKHGIIKFNETISGQDKQRLIDNKKLSESNTLVNDMEEFIKQQQRSIDLYGVTNEAAKLQYDIEHDIVKVVGGAQSAQAARAIANQKQLDYLQEYKNLSQLTIEAAERVDEAFGSAWKNIDDGFTGLRDGIVDGFKTMLAEMAHQAITKPIILQVQQSLTGAVGQVGADAIGSNVNAAIGGYYAAGALAVVAAVNVWNKQQDEKFRKMTAEYKQANQSLSRVLGEGNKKSTAISNGIDLLTQTDSDVLDVNNDMLNTLLDIRSGISDVAAGFAKTLTGSGDYEALGITEGKTTMNGYAGAALLGGGIGLAVKGAADLIGGDVGGFINGVIGKVSSALYSKKKKVIDSGIQIIGGNLADIINGSTLQAFNYADVKTTKKVIGITTSSKVKRSREDLDDTFENQISGVFKSAGDALEDASAVFGINFDNYINQLSVKSQDLSLMGLEGDELTKEIESFFGNTLDDWAEVLLGGTSVLKDFQSIGESAFDTMIRLASETQTFDKYADMLGLNFNAIGQDAVYAVQSLAELSGGFDELSSAAATYYDKFFDDGDKFASLQESLGDAFNELGYALPKTRDEFKNLIGGLNLVTEAGQEQFASLIKLSGATDEYITALDRENKAKEDALREAVSGAFDVFSKAVEKDRAAVESQIDAANDALSSTKAVTDSLRSALKSMTLETAENALTTRRAAQAQIITANAIAKAGGPLPIAGQLDGALAVLAQPSQDLYASFEDYARDFYSTSKNIKELADATGEQETIEQKNLDVLNSQLTALDDLVEYYQTQIDKLGDIDTSVISVSSAVNKLTETLIDAGVTGVVAKSATPVLSTAYETQQSVQSNAVAATNAEVTSVGYGDLVALVQTLTDQLEASQYAIAKNTLATSKTLTRWDIDGMPETREVVS